MAISSLKNTSFRGREKLSRDNFRNQLWRTKNAFFLGSHFLWTLIFIFSFYRFAAFYLLMGDKEKSKKRWLGKSKKKEPPLSFLKDESKNVRIAIHSILLIKDIYWTRRQTLIRYILNSRMDAYFAWIEKFKEFPEDLSAVLSKEQIKLINSCADWNDKRLLTINVQTCPEWQTAFKDWRERINMHPNSPIHKHWACELARCHDSSNTTNCNSNAKEEKRQYYQEEICLCKFYNNNCWRCRTPSDAERFKRQNARFHPSSSGGIASPTGEKAGQSLSQEPGYEIINDLNGHTQEKPSSSGNIKVADDDGSDLDMRDISIIKFSRKQERREGEQPISSNGVNRQQIYYETTSQYRTQDAQQILYYGVESSNDINQYGITLTRPVAQLNQQHYERNDGTCPPRRSAMILDAGKLVSAEQQRERNPQNSSERQLNSRTQLSNSDKAYNANYQEGREQSAFSRVQQRSTSHASDSLENGFSFVQEPVENGEESLDKTNEQERNLPNRNQRQIDSRTKLSNSDESNNANYQEGREQSAFSHVQQRSTSYASDSLENGFYFVQEPAINDQQGSAIHKTYSSSQETKQALPSREIQPAENGGESLDKTSDKYRAQALVESFQQEGPMVQESFVSQEEQNSVAQEVQSKNKEESVQSNINEKAENKNSNSVQMENSIIQPSALEEGSDQKSQEKPKITDKTSSPNPTHSAGNSSQDWPNNGQRGSSSHPDKLADRVAGTPGKTQSAQSCLTGRFEENTQKNPRAYSLASLKRPPLQPFPRIAKKKTALSHYSPAITLTNQEGIAAYYNLILVGDSNVGKTTLFNSSASYLLSESEAEAFGNPMFLSDVSFRVTENSRSELISVQANFKSEDGLAGNSSQHPFMEEITYYDPKSGKMKMLRILDTPGINDEQGVINVENILKTAKLMGEIHGIGILIGPNEVRMKMNFALALNRLLGQFDKSAIKNLLFFYTKVTGPTYAPGDGYPLIENYLKAAEIDLPLDLGNVFRFDNGWFRSLCIKQFNSKNGKAYEVPACTGWSHSKNEMERLMKRLSREPYKVEESVFLDDTKRFLEELAEPVSQCLQKFIEKSYEIEGITEEDQPQLMARLKEKDEMKKTFDQILKKCSQLAAFLQKNTIVPGIDPFLEHFTSLRDIEKEKDEYSRVKSHHLPILRSTCEKYVAELNNVIPNVTKPNIEEIKEELVVMPYFREIFFNAFGGKIKF